MNGNDLVNFFTVVGFSWCAYALYRTFVWCACWLLVAYVDYLKARDKKP